MKDIDISLNFTIRVPKDVEINDATKVTFSEKGIHIHHQYGESIVSDPSIEEFGEYNDDDE